MPSGGARARPTLPLDATGRPVALREVDLDSFFRPETVAVIGASDTPGRPNTLVYGKLLEWARRTGARMYPVNPNRERIGDLPCSASIAEVPASVDVAVVLVGDAVTALEEVVAEGARFAVVFAAGFAEVGGEGAALQRRVEELVAGSETFLLGPNTNLNAFELFRDDLDGPALTLITQSGHQGRPVFQGQDLGIRISHWAPTGNEADLEFADFARWFADQPDTGAVACYIEGFKDGRSLALAADHAVRRGVPIVCVKVGRTAEGRAMSLSHTGHLTGSDEVISAVFRQYGVVRVDGLDELLDTAAMLARSQPPAGDGGVCIYSISGGTGAHMADMAAAAGLPLPTLARETQRMLHQWIPGYLTVSNPVDNGGHPAGDERGRKILDAILADPNVDVLVCPITGAVPPIDERLARDLVEAAETTDKPVCVIWGSPVGDEMPYREILLRSRVPVFRSFRNCVQAVKAYLEYHAFRASYVSPFVPRGSEGPMAAAEPSPAAAVARPLLAPGGPLSEPESKDLLAAYGIAVSRDEQAGDADEAVKAADALGYPVVLKAFGRELAHKSDLGLVEVGLRDAVEVREAAERMAASEAPVEGLLVSELVGGGVETVLGVSHDDLFGPVVMFGLGGVFVEVLRDVTFRVPPFGEDEARRMIQEVRGYPLLTGTRGRSPADLDGLVAAVMAVQRLAVDCAHELVELDVNPLLVRPAGAAGPGAVALDALAVARRPGASGASVGVEA